MFGAHVETLPGGTAAVPNIGALTAASNTAGAAAAGSDAAKWRNRSPAQDLPSIFTVEVIGYGGGDGTGSHDNGVPQREQRRRPDQQSYNPNSAFQVLGAGNLTDGQKQGLAEAEKQKPAGP